MADVLHGPPLRGSSETSRTVVQPALVDALSGPMTGNEAGPMSLAKTTADLVPSRWQATARPVERYSVRHLC